MKRVSSKTITNFLVEGDIFLKFKRRGIGYKNIEKLQLKPNLTNFQFLEEL